MTSAQAIASRLSRVPGVLALLVKVGDDIHSECRGPLREQDMSELLPFLSKFDNVRIQTDGCGTRLTLNSYCFTNDCIVVVVTKTGDCLLKSLGRAVNRAVKKQIRTALQMPIDKVSVA